MSKLKEERAILMLEDGTLFEGVSVGASSSATGEVVFNTSMTGYQEILTDPSYKGQIVTLTYPHIGNVGVNLEDMEAAKSFLSGLVIKDLPNLSSNYRKTGNLGSFLKEAGIPAISDIDTRMLTRILREDGSKKGCLMVGDCCEDIALKKAVNSAGLKGKDLAVQVGCTESYDWNQTEWDLNFGYGESGKTQSHVVAIDFGIKKNILRKLASRACKITVVPPTSSSKEILDLSPDGVFLSNGPGDPQPCLYAIESIKVLLQNTIPIFGICLGHQLLALACGAKTKKMKFGHHGANHPVKDEKSGRVVISSQNHGFCVSKEGLPSDLRVTHLSLFDGTIQGLEVVNRPFFSFQGHPEASPGPHDIDYLFDKFVAMMR